MLKLSYRVILNCRTAVERVDLRDVSLEFICVRNVFTGINCSKCQPVSNTMYLNVASANLAEPQRHSFGQPLITLTPSLANEVQTFESAIHLAFNALSKC